MCLFGSCKNNVIITTSCVLQLHSYCTGLWWQLPRNKQNQNKQFCHTCRFPLGLFKCERTTELQFYHLSDIEEQLQETIQL